MPEFTVDWTTGHAADWEEYLIHLNGKPAIGLEIGVYEGRSTEWFCRNILTGDKSRLICVDLFADKARYGRFLQNVIYLDLLHKLDIRRQPSEQMALPPHYLDFAYIDGWHSADAVMTDSVLAWRSLKAGGILIWDDYFWPGKAQVPYLPPKPAIDSFLHLYGTKLEVLVHSHHVIVRKK